MESDSENDNSDDEKKTVDDMLEDENFHSAESDSNHKSDSNDDDDDDDDDNVDKRKEEKNVRHSSYSGKQNAQKGIQFESTSGIKLSGSKIDQNENHSSSSNSIVVRTKKPVDTTSTSDVEDKSNSLSTRKTGKLQDHQSSSDEEDGEGCKVILVEVPSTESNLTPGDIESVMKKKCNLSGDIKVKHNDEDNNSFLVFFNTASDAISALSKIKKIYGVKVKLSFFHDIKSDDDEEEECKAVLFEVMEKDKSLTCDAVELHLESKKRCGYDIEEVKQDVVSKAFLVIFKMSSEALSALSKVKKINDVKVKLSFYHEDPAVFGKNLPESVNRPSSQNKVNSNSGSATNSNAEAEEEEEGCKAVVIQVSSKETSDKYLTCDIIELFLANKKAGGYKVTESHYNKKSNEYLIIFEKASDAKHAMSLKEIKGVNVFLKPYCGDPENFAPKELTIKVPISDKDKYKAEYLVKKKGKDILKKSLKSIQVDCEYKSLNIDKKNKFFKLKYYSYETANTQEAVTEKANKIFIDLMKEINVKKFELRPGINISQDIKKMNEMENVLVDKEETNVRILSDDKDEIINCFEKLTTAVKIVEKELEDKKLVVELVRSTPGKILFLRTFLLDKLQLFGDLTYKLERVEISVQGPIKEVTSMKSKISELLHKIEESPFDLKESAMLSFFNQPQVIDQLNDKLKSEVGECCLSMNDERVLIIVRNNSSAFAFANNLIEKHVSCRKIDIPDIDLLKHDMWIRFVKILREEYCQIILQTKKESQIMTIIGFTEQAEEVENKVQEFIHENTSLKKIVTCEDDNKVKYIQKYCQDLISDIKDQVSKTGGCQVNITPTHDSSWSITGNQEQIKKIEAELLEACSKILVEKITIDFFGVSSLFKGHESKGKEILSWLMTKNKCIIIDGQKTSREGKKLERISQWLFNSTKIVVVKGDIRLLNADTIVNAANTNLSHGAGLAKAMVDMGGKCIQDECDDYVKRNKALSEGEVMVSGPGHLACKKVIHAVGPVWKGGNEGEEEKLNLAVKNSLKEAMNENLTSIAIPPISTGLYNYPKQNASTTIIKTICSFLNTKSPSKIQTIYLCDLKMDMLHLYCKQLKTLIGEASVVGENWIEDREEEQGAVGGVSITESEGSDGGHSSDQDSDHNSWWDCGLRSRGKKNGSSVDPPRSPQLKIKTGELDKIKADVLVNCTSPKLELRSGAVSKALLSGAGNSIQDECNRKYKDGIQPGEVAVTSAGKLQAFKIYHGTLLPYMGKEKEYAENTLKIFVKKCLSDAASHKMKSICFPALGCGKLNFPADISANILFKEVQKFLQNNSDCSLQEVIFLIHPKDEAVQHAYKEVSEELYLDMIYESPRRELSYPSENCGNIQVEICNGDITKETTDCIVNVCGSSMDMKYGISKIIADTAGPELRDECSRKRRDFASDGVALTTAGELQAKLICHIKIQKSVREWISLIKKALYMIMKEDVSSISFPAIGTGGLKIPAQESARFMHTALKEFGQKNRYSKIEKVRIVIFQSDGLKDFETVFGTKRKRSHHKHSGSTGRTSRRSNSQEDGLKPTKSQSKKEEVELTIYAENSKNMDTIKTKLKKRLNEEKSEKSTADTCDSIVYKLKSSEWEDINTIAKRYNVKIEKDASNKKIVIKGLTGQVNEAYVEINDLLQKQLSKKQKQLEKGIISSFVDWEYEECSGGKRHSFGKGVSCMLEKAYSNKEKEVKFSDHRNRRYTVNFKDMMEYPDGGSRKPVRVFRINKNQGEGVVRQFKEEEEALKGKKTVYIPIQPSRSYDDTKPEEFHFRLAESQFCRLLGTNAQFYVNKVEYVVNPVLRSKFSAAQEQLKKSRGDEASKPVLAFHGTKESNINSICENGFLMPGDGGFNQVHGAKYGRGTYFSEFPDYSMRYISGSTKLLLCKVLLGKAYECLSLRQTSQLEQGYDSHVSADKKELVVFNKDRILPCYIVHYTQQSSDYSYH